MRGLDRVKLRLGNPDDRNKVILLGALFVVLAVVLILNTDIRGFIPDLRNYGLRLRQYEELANELADAQSDLLEAQANSVRRAEVWRAVDSEDPRLAVLQKLEGIAAECGVKLRTTGNLKDVQLANGVIGYELDVNAAEAPLSSVCRFIIAVGMSQPRFFWENITIKPSGGNVVLGGKLKVIVITSRAALENYWGDGDA